MESPGHANQPDGTDMLVDFLRDEGASEDASAGTEPVSAPARVGLDEEEQSKPPASDRRLAAENIGLSQQHRGSSNFPASSLERAENTYCGPFDWACQGYEDDMLAKALQQHQGNSNFPTNSPGRTENTYRGPFDWACQGHEDDMLLAKALQQEEYAARPPAATSQMEASDMMIAQMMQNGEYENFEPSPLMSYDESCGDAALAQLLQEDEYQQDDKTPESYMMATNTGKAVMFVGEMIETVAQIHAISADPRDLEVDTISRDDLVFIAQKLLETQESFIKQGKSFHVDLGYHFTREEALDRIRTDGLLNQKDQLQNNAPGNRLHRGTGYFGDGVYTANNPFTFGNFGPVGLLVARIKGQSLQWGSRQVTDPDQVSGYDAVIGNKSPGNEQTVEVVLRGSSQVLPLLRFSKSVLYSDPSLGHGHVENALEKYLAATQSLVDKFFNVSCGAAVSQDMVYAEAVADPAPSFGKLPVATVVSSPTNAQPGPASNPLPRAPSTTSNSSPAGISLAAYTLGRMRSFGFVSRRSARAAASAAHGGPSIRNQAAQNAGQTEDSTNSGLFRRWSYTAPDQIFDAASTNLDSLTVPITKASPGDCPICLEPIPAPAGSGAASGSCALGCELKICGHATHKQCLSRALQSANKCPVCRLCVSKPQGASPSGTMDVSYCPSSAQIEGHRAIQLLYVLEGGIQRSYHENPGQGYPGDRRVAYLPDSPGGVRLLRRLVFAFCHGLTFRVGTSLTTRSSNRVTWASIHHKTSCRPGPHGYPDPGYFFNCNDELNQLGVPEEPNLEGLH